MMTLRTHRPLLASLAFAAMLVTGCANADTVLVTGANSGIGLEFARQYAERDWKVIATHRRDETPATLAELAEEFANVRVERMDVTSREQVHALAERLRGEPVDVLINNAGVFSMGDWLDRTDTSQRFGTLDHDHFDVFMRTNVRGPVMVSEAFIEHVKASRQKKIVTITSTIGTISTPEVSVNAFWYGTSKAALNKATVTLAEVLRPDGVIVVPMHPGAVRVERQESLRLPGMLETPESVRSMIETISGLGMEHTGRFLNYDGSGLPW